MTAWDYILANWSVDSGLSHDAALLALGTTSSFLEARRLCKEGASERVIRLQLDKALRGIGMAKAQVD